VTDLALVYRSADELIPYARNARTHSDAQIAQIAGSIREFGFTNPVLLDGEKGILAGHGRVLGARKLGMERVPCIELAHLSPAQRRAYILADNKLALNAGWDEALLRVEMEDLAGFDLSLVGFSGDELASLLPGASGNASGPGGGKSHYQEQYGVIVVCRDEAHQRETFEALVGLGYEPKVVVT
jgi:ParB-like chromosome segregation protein Spo0J